MTTLTFNTKRRKLNPVRQGILSAFEDLSDQEDARAGPSTPDAMQGGDAALPWAAAQQAKARGAELAAAGQYATALAGERRCTRLLCRPLRWHGHAMPPACPPPLAALPCQIALTSHLKQQTCRARAAWDQALHSLPDDAAFHEMRSQVGWPAAAYLHAPAQGRPHGMQPSWPASPLAHGLHLHVTFIQLCLVHRQWAKSALPVWHR